MSLLFSACDRGELQAAGGPSGEEASGAVRAEASSPTPPEWSSARVVLLGTGGPPPDPKRSGPSLAVVSKGRSYLVDFGPGVVRRAIEALNQGVRALHPRKLNRAFATHLHSDHTAGLSDLILTPPAVGRIGPLEVYGPPGIAKMTEHILMAYAEDYAIRIKGLSKRKAAGYTAVPHEVAPGVVYRDDAVVVTAFRVLHGDWKEAYGYRFDADGRSIVISGDTAPCDEVVKACAGCDVLVHEVYCVADIEHMPPTLRGYFTSHHTSTAELAKIANRAKPKLLVLNHLLLRSCTPEDLTAEMVEYGYSGEVAVGEDLAVY